MNRFADAQIAALRAVEARFPGSLLQFEVLATFDEPLLHSSNYCDSGGDDLTPTTCTLADTLTSPWCPNCLTSVSDLEFASGAQETGYWLLFNVLDLTDVCAKLTELQRRPVDLDGLKREVEALSEMRYLLGTIRDDMRACPPRDDVRLRAEQLEHESLALFDITRARARGGRNLIEDEARDRVLQKLRKALGSSAAQGAFEPLLSAAECIGASRDVITVLPGGTALSSNSTDLMGFLLHGSDTYTSLVFLAHYQAPGYLVTSATLASALSEALDLRASSRGRTGEFQALVEPGDTDAVFETATVLVNDGSRDLPAALGAARAL